jgi:DNA polymerase III subunit delta
MALLELKKGLQKIRKQISTLPVLFVYDEEGARIEDWARFFFTGAESGSSQDLKPEIFYADELSFEDFLAIVQAQSLFASEKNVWIRAAEKWSPKEMERVLGQLETIDTGVKVFLELRRWDGRTKWTQSLVKSESLSVLKLDPMNPMELKQWLFSAASARGYTIENDAADLLLEWTEGQAIELMQALVRASLYAGERKQILTADVEAIGIRVSSSNIFDFSAAVVLGQRREALDRLERLLAEGEEPIAVLGLLARQFRWLLSIQSARAEGLSEGEIPLRCGIFPSAARVLLPGAKRRGGQDILKSLDLLARWDQKLKSSQWLSRPELMRSLVLSLTQ